MLRSVMMRSVRKAREDKFLCSHDGSVTQSAEKALSD